MLEKIRDCFRKGRVYYSKHARDEMDSEEFGEIRDEEVNEAIQSGNVIESYPEDEPYPSCLIYGRTSHNRPVHAVCAYSEEEEMIIVVTAYEPNPERWVDFRRRRP